MSKLLLFAKRYIFALPSTIYLFAIGFLFGRNRSLIAKISAHFGYNPKGFAEILPTVDMLDTFSENVPIAVKEPQGEDGNISLLELIRINQLVINTKPKSIFEIGTFDGRTTLNMAANSAKDTTIFTLDLPRSQADATALPTDRSDKPYMDKDTPGIRFRQTPEEKKISQLLGDSATFDYSPYQGSADFVFIDGSHSYEYTLNDTKTARTLLRDGKGILVWHDYGGWPGVTKALNELYTNDLSYSCLKQISGTSLVFAVFE